MTNIQPTQETVTHSDLFIVFEFTDLIWRMIFIVGSCKRVVSLEIGDWMGVKAEIEITKIRLQCAKDCQVYSCYESKRQGHWFHRALLAEGIHSFVFGPSVKPVGSNQMTQTMDVEDILWKLMQRVSVSKFETGRLF